MVPKVLSLVGDHDGCALWRVFLPFSELQRRGYPAEWGDRNDDKLALIAHHFDAISLPRLHWKKDDQVNAQRWFDALHAAGIAVIYEVDDDMLSNDFWLRLTTTHDLPPEKADEVQDGIKHTLANVDGVTVSTPYLAKQMKRRTTKPVEVVPNFIDLEWFRRVQSAADRRVKGLTVGWAGGIRPDTDVYEMALAWGRIARRHSNVSFVVMGHHARVIYDQVPHDRIFALDWHPIDSYPMGLVNIDIGCCPLADTPFNRAKTPIKAFEYAASGAAVVASPTVYGEIIEPGYDGFICRSADEWEAALSRLVTSANVRTRLAQRLLTKIERHHSLKKNVMRWPVAWSVIVEEFRKKRVYVPTRGQLLAHTGGLS